MVCVNTRFGTLRPSVFFWQQNTGRRTVSFGNHPEPVPRARAIHAQEPEAMLQTGFVFLDVFRGNFSPITTDMTSKKIPRLLARFSNRSQRAGGGDQMTECEERLHALDSTDAICFSQRSRTTAFSGFAMNPSRSFHVIAAKRGHSFPPIWLKMTLVNLPSAVRRAALARTPVATLIAGFGCFTAGVAFVFEERLFRGFVSLFGFLRFFICVPSHGTREPCAYFERSKVRNNCLTGTPLTMQQRGDSSPVISPVTIPS